MIEWITDTNGRSGKYKTSHMFKHSIEANNSTVTLDNFTALSSRYSNRKLRRKVSESIYQT